MAMEGGKMETTILEQQLKINLKSLLWNILKV